MMTTFYTSPIGILKLSCKEDLVTELIFVDNETVDEYFVAEGILIKTMQQLDEYFDGKRTDFDLKIGLTGTNFQLRVWNELLKIPYGKTISYLELAKRLGDEKVIRAAASANGKNKLAVIVPCHRVIGSNNELTGYAGGLQRKKWLLEFEKKTQQVIMF